MAGREGRRRYIGGDGNGAKATAPIGDWRSQGAARAAFARHTKSIPVTPNNAGCRGFGMFIAIEEHSQEWLWYMKRRPQPGVAVLRALRGWLGMTIEMLKGDAREQYGYLSFLWPFSQFHWGEGVLYPYNLRAKW